MRSILSFMLLSFFYTAPAQDVAVMLRNEIVPTTPAGYHISGVMDDRADTSSIGIIHYADGGTGKLYLPGGASGIKEFTDRNVTQDRSSKPIFLHISSLNIQARNTNGEWSYTFTSTIVFYASGYKLIEYSDKATAETTTPPAEYADEHIRKMIDKDLKAFNEWWPENSGSISTSEGVKVNVSLGTAMNGYSQMAYSLARPLRIADFTGPVTAQGNEAAETSSGIDYKMSGTVENGQTVVNIVVTPYFEGDRSWFKEEGKTPEILAHEQAHFDITAIKACALIQEIRSATFTKDNYQQLIRELYQKTEKAAYDEENNYDEETNHGIIRDKQVEWQNRLAQQVRTVGCY